MISVFFELSFIKITDNFTKKSIIKKVWKHTSIDSNFDVVAEYDYLFYTTSNYLRRK